MYCVDVVAFALTLGYRVGRLLVLPPVLANHELFNFSIDFSDAMIFAVKFVQEHLQVGMHPFSFLQGFGCGGDDTGSGASNGIALTA